MIGPFEPRVDSLGGGNGSPCGEHSIGWTVSTILKESGGHFE